MKKISAQTSGNLSDPSSGATLTTTFRCASVGPSRGLETISYDGGGQLYGGGGKYGGGDEGFTPPELL